MIHQPFSVRYNISIPGSVLNKLSVTGNISSTRVVYASGGNSNLWNSTYSSVNASSARVDSVYTNVNTSSANWNSVYSNVFAASANYILDGGNTKGANIIIGTNDAFNLNLETANATRMTVTSAGNVGIGNTAPSAILDVRNAYGLPSSSNGTIRILSTDAAGTAGVGATLSLGGNAANASRNAVTLLGANQSTSGDRGYLGIFTNGTGISTAYGERLRIDSDGSTIINPVNNNTVGTKGLIIRASSGQTGNLTEWQNSSNVGIGAVSSDGNFGIGIVAPTSKLHIVGNVTIGTGVLDLDAGYSIRWGGAASGIYSGSGTSDMVVTVGSAERLRINGSTGNVGIGVTSPGAKLTVSGTISSNNVIDAVGGNSNLWNSTYATVSSLSANYILAGGNTKSANITIGTNDNFNLNLETANATRMTVTSAGDVGIGITSPVEKLDVVGNVKVSGHFSAVTKSFLIDHPTKVNKKLQYGVVESNQHSVLVRGRTAKNVIELPEEWPGLVHENSITVQLTPVGTYQKLFVILQDNEKVVVGGVNGLYNYTIYGERKDVDKLIIET